MKQLVATSNVSYVESLKIALEAEDIPVMVNNAAMAPLQPMTVWVADDDFAEAVRIAQTLQTISTPVRMAGAPKRKLSIGLVLLALAFLFLFAQIW